MQHTLQQDLNSVPPLANLLSAIGSPQPKTKHGDDTVSVCLAFLKSTFPSVTLSSFLIPLPSSVFKHSKKGAMSAVLSTEAMSRLIR